jgi:hypothetical protein
MLLCDVASLIRLSMRFVPPTPAGELPDSEIPWRWRLDYNIGPRSTNTEEDTGDTGKRRRVPASPCHRAPASSRPPFCSVRHDLGPVVSLHAFVIIIFD